MKKNIKRDIDRIIRNINWRIKWIAIRRKVGACGMIIAALIYFIISLAPLVSMILIMYIIAHFIIKFW